MPPAARDIKVALRQQTHKEHLQASRSGCIIYMVSTKAGHGLTYLGECTCLLEKKKHENKSNKTKHTHKTKQNKPKLKQNQTPHTCATPKYPAALADQTKGVTSPHRYAAAKPPRLRKKSLCVSHFATSKAIVQISKPLSKGSVPLKLKYPSLSSLSPNSDNCTANALQSLA